jgi:imidazolonepropionase-like amidohydrolase
VGPIHFPFEDLQVIVDKAHSLGLKVMAHADSDLAVDMSLRSGIDFIEHGYHLSRESLLRMAELQRCWTPTLMPVYIWTIVSGVNPEYKSIAERIYRRHQEMIKQAFDMGITIGVGTDSGSPSIKHGELYYKELELYSEAELSTGQIIRAATTNGSYITGNSPGILKGHPANLLVLEENPLYKGISALKKTKYTLHG